jgi:hypothetical protein
VPPTRSNRSVSRREPPSCDPVPSIRVVPSERRAHTARALCSAGDHHDEAQMRMLERCRQSRSDTEQTYKTPSQSADHLRRNDGDALVSPQASATEPAWRPASSVPNERRLPLVPPPRAVRWSPRLFRGSGF